MNLIEKMMETCCYMTKEKTPDGSGGSFTTWTDGAKFKAAITLDTTLDARIAERSGVTSVYTVTTKRNVNLEYHDVIKRLRDGKIFRVTSDAGDKVSPSFSALDIAQVTAEKWELTK